MKAFQVETCTDKIKVIHSTHNNIGVEGAHFFRPVFLVFKRWAGFLRVCGGKEMIQAIPKPNFWRAPTGHDCGNLVQPCACNSGGKRPVCMSAIKARRRRVRRKSRNTNTALPVRSAILCRPHRFLECRLSYGIWGSARENHALCIIRSKNWATCRNLACCLNLMPITTDCSGMDWANRKPVLSRCKGAKLGIYSNKVKRQCRAVYGSAGMWGKMWRALGRY